MDNLPQMLCFICERSFSIGQAIKVHAYCANYSLCLMSFRIGKSRCAEEEAKPRKKKKNDELKTAAKPEVRQ